MIHKAVLFDMDGVILDSIPLHHQAAQAVFKTRGHELSYADYKRYFAGETDAEGFAQYCKLIGMQHDLAPMLRQKADEYERLAATTSLTPCPGSVACIRWFADKQLPLALVTGSLRAEAELVLRAFDLTDVFQAVVTADDVTHGKPNPEGYLKGAAALGMQPADCLVIEDAPSGIQAARAAGMHCIAVTTTYPAAELQQAHSVVPRLYAGLASR